MKQRTRISEGCSQRSAVALAAICCGVALAMSVVLTTPTRMYAQGKGGKGGGKGGDGAAAAPQNAKAMAPIDLTGYWVSVITEDWRYRMVTPSKGDFQGVPMTGAARTVANAWDPEKEQSSGGACKAYGAPGLMRLPGRLHITWLDDNTLKMDTDIGKQTRLFHFGDWKSPGGPPTIQGDSIADWEGAGGGGRGGRGGGGGGGARGGRGSGLPSDASLKVLTTNLTGGFLRKNGVPYSDKTSVTEYWDLMTEPNGAQMVVVTISTTDPTYLTRPFVVSSQYKKEPGDTNAKWEPTECSAKW
jgi:hypothetical protein